LKIFGITVESFAFQAHPLKTFVNKYELSNLKKCKIQKATSKGMKIKKEFKTFIFVSKTRIFTHFY